MTGDESRDEPAGATAAAEPANVEPPDAKPTSDEPTSDEPAGARPSGAQPPGAGLAGRREPDTGWSAHAVARSLRLDRAAVSAVGLAASLAGLAGLVVGLEWLGAGRAARPLADPIALDWLRANALPARVAALLLGAMLLVLGVVWLVRSVRPEPRPDLTLDSSANGIQVTASAIADAIRADAETVYGVSDARVRVVGVRGQPAFRLQLSLRHGADVRAVWNELDGRVLDRARQALGVPTIPIAVRLELGSAQRQRVR